MMLLHILLVKQWVTVFGGIHVSKFAPFCIV